MPAQPYLLVLLTKYVREVAQNHMHLPMSSTLVCARWIYICRNNPSGFPHSHLCTVSPIAKPTQCKTRTRAACSLGFQYGKGKPPHPPCPGREMAHCISNDDMISRKISGRSHVHRIDKMLTRCLNYVSFIWEQVRFLDPWHELVQIRYGLHTLASKLQWW